MAIMMLKATSLNLTEQLLRLTEELVITMRKVSLLKVKPYTDGYYDAQGNFITSSGTIISKDGEIINIGPDAGVIDSKGNIILPDGTVITPDGKIGYYNEKGQFVEGIKPYKDGYYDAQGNFIKSDGIVITLTERLAIITNKENLSKV